MPYKSEIKAIKLLQDGAKSIADSHEAISSDLVELKKALMSIDGAGDLSHGEAFTCLKHEIYEQMSQTTSLLSFEVESIYAEAEARYQGSMGLADILSVEDFEQAQARINHHVLAFNNRYGLDGWDYAIACSCGLFAAMLDILCIRAPSKPTVPWSQKVDGTFNGWVQEAFNKVLPPDLSDALSKQYPIGAPDSSTVFDLIGAPDKALNPLNHRLRSLAHDPILGLIFGVWDMAHGTCTTVVNGQIISIPSRKGPTDGGLFQLLGKMLGHLLSDVNAPSGHGNRGMGLPAPFMGLLRMLEGIPIGDSNFGKQIEWMYVNGYDFRQFAATSVPMLIMEVLLRVFYVGKQVVKYDQPFGESLLDTMPVRLNPRVRMMLAIAYGTSSAVNAGKIYVTGDILNANYASWMGLAWNGFHSLKWALLDKHLKLWGELEEKEIVELDSLILKLDELEQRASRLPI